MFSLVYALNKQHLRAYAYSKPCSLKNFSAPGCRGADKPFFTMSSLTRCAKAGCRRLKSSKLLNTAFTTSYTYSSATSSEVTKVANTPYVGVSLGLLGYKPPGIATLA